MITRNQVINVRTWLQVAANSATAAFWSGHVSDMEAEAHPYHTEEMLRELEAACNTLGYVMTPAPDVKP